MVSVPKEMALSQQGLHFLGRQTIAEFHRRQPGRFDFQQRDVGALVAADDLGLELAFVVELDGDFIGRFDDVRIGQNETVRADDEARALRLGEMLLRRLAAAALMTAAIALYVIDLS